MNDVAYCEPELSAKKSQWLEAGRYDFLIQSKSELVLPFQCAEALRGDRRRLSYVYSMISEGKLESVGPRHRDKARVLITRRSLQLLIAEQFQGDLNQFIQRLHALVDVLSPVELQSLADHANARLSAPFLPVLPTPLPETNGANGNQNLAPNIPAS